MSEKREPVVHFMEEIGTSDIGTLVTETACGVDARWETEEVEDVTCGNCRRTRAFREAKG